MGRTRSIFESKRAKLMFRGHRRLYWRRGTVLCLRAALSVLTRAGRNLWEQDQARAVTCKKTTIISWYRNKLNDLIYFFWAGHQFLIFAKIRVFSRTAASVPDQTDPGFGFTMVESTPGYLESCFFDRMCDNPFHFCSQFIDISPSDEIKTSGRQKSIPFFNSYLKITG